jgi:hypothetical protein
MLEVKADPNLPPLPPHVSLEQMRKFAANLLSPDPQEGSVLLDTARGAERRAAGAAGLVGGLPKRDGCVAASMESCWGVG